jgi:hypothetical protein
MHTGHNAFKNGFRNIQLIRKHDGIEPLTAQYFFFCLFNLNSVTFKCISFIQFVCNEMEPERVYRLTVRGHKHSVRTIKIGRN